MKAKRIFVLCNCNYVTLLESILQLSVRLFDLKRMGIGHEPIRIVNNMAFNIITYYKTKIKSNFFIQTDTNCCFFRSSYLTAAIICRIFRLLIDISCLDFKIFFLGNYHKNNSCFFSDGFQDLIYFYSFPFFFFICWVRLHSYVNKHKRAKEKEEEKKSNFLLRFASSLLLQPLILIKSWITSSKMCTKNVIYNTMAGISNHNRKILIFSFIFYNMPQHPGCILIASERTSFDIHGSIHNGEPFKHIAMVSWRYWQFSSLKQDRSTPFD